MNTYRGVCAPPERPLNPRLGELEIPLQGDCSAGGHCKGLHGQVRFHLQGEQGEGGHQQEREGQGVHQKEC